MSSKKKIHHRLAQFSQMNQFDIKKKSIPICVVNDPPYNEHKQKTPTEAGV